MLSSDVTEFLKLQLNESLLTHAIQIHVVDMQRAKTKMAMQLACACLGTLALHQTVGQNVPSMLTVPILLRALDKSVKILVLAFVVKMPSATSRTTTLFANASLDTLEIRSHTARRNQNHPKTRAFQIHVVQMPMDEFQATDACVNVKGTTLEILLLVARENVSTIKIVP